MKVRVIKTGEILEVMDYNDSQVEVYRDDFTEFLAQNIYGRDEVELLFNDPAPEKAVDEGYAVKWHDGEVTVFQRKPTKLIGDDKTFCGWHSEDGCKLFLPKDSLPSVTCENSPQRVKIEITLIDEKGE